MSSRPERTSSSSPAPWTYSLLELLGQALVGAGRLEQPVELVDEERVLRLLLAALHAAEADVAEVLHPLEVADRDAAGVGVEVGDDDDALLAQDVVGAGGDRAVGGLDDQRRADAVGVAEVDHRFHRRRDQDVAVVLEDRGAVLDVGAAGEVLDAAVWRRCGS